MKLSSTRKYAVIPTILAFAALLTTLANADAPQGWFMSGSKPADYETGVEAKMTYNGHPSAYLKSRNPDSASQKTSSGESENSTPGPFGTLMQSFRADQYLGKRVRFSAFVKSEGVQENALLWMRVDKGNAMVAFDNMSDRPIKGSTDWHSYEIVLDVPPDATSINFGVLLAGTGEVWMNSAKFEVVGTSVALTGQPQSKEAPANLDFEK